MTSWWLRASRDSKYGSIGITKNHLYPDLFFRIKIARFYGSNLSNQLDTVLDDIIIEYGECFLRKNRIYRTEFKTLKRQTRTSVVFVTTSFDWTTIGYSEAVRKYAESYSRLSLWKRNTFSYLFLIYQSLARVTSRTSSNATFTNEWQIHVSRTRHKSWD